MDSVLQDVRYALRTLAKSPAFTAVSLITLALGIGANTAIFSVVDAVFLHPLAVEEPDRLVRVFTSDERNPGHNNVSFPNYRDYRDQSDGVLSGLAAWAWVPLSLAGGGAPEHLFGQTVTANYFSVLGVRPTLGRGFLPQEEDQAVAVAVLSHGLWQRRFGGDRSVVGSTVALNGAPFTIVGVAPASFTGLDVGVRPELWVPVGMHARVLPADSETFEDRRTLSFDVVGRLRPGSSEAAARAALQEVARRLVKAYPEPNAGRGVLVVSVDKAAVQVDSRETLSLAGGVLMAIVGFVLLIACANVANLLLARAGARRREIAVRLALGAGRLRLARQLVTENLLLSAMAGGLGLLLGRWAYALLWSLRPSTPFSLELPQDLDGRVLAFSLAASILSGLAFGLVPVLQATRADLASDLKNRSDSTGGSGRRFGLRGGLVVSQVALSLVVLIGAGLCVRSLRKAEGVDPGFDAAHLAVASVDLGAQGYTQARAEEFYRRLLERSEAIPGVASATFSTNVPLFGGGFGRTVFVEGQEEPPGGNGAFVTTNVVGPRYFSTLSIPIRQGRDFLPDDRPGGRPVAIVNQSMARRFWPKGNTLGARFHFFGGEVVEIVGIAADSAIVDVTGSSQPCAYIPFAQSYAEYATLQVRTSGDPAPVVGLLHREIRAIDEQLPLIQATTMSRIVEDALWAPRMATRLLAVFGALALLLAAIGIYGVVAYTASQRTREIGVRIAMGAGPSEVFRLVVGGGLSMTGAGLALGIVAGLALARAMSSLLFGVGALDLVTFGVVPLVLGGVSFLASALPARQATRMDPIVALRSE